MKIGVVSDTHSISIPKQLIQDFKSVDFIVHAGDFCSLEDFKIFQGINQVKAVFGNMDDPALQQVLPQRQVFKCEGFSIGLFHGHGTPRPALDNAMREFKSSKVDVVIFGHSHEPYNEVINNVLYFNPGSPNDIVRAPYCSYGTIEFKSGQIIPKIIKVK